MRGAAVLLAALAIICPSARADESPEVPTPAQAADAVEQAHAAGDEATLERIAKRGDPDPWTVAEFLCARGEVKAAAALAGAYPGPDAGRLGDYVQVRVREPVDAAFVRLVDRARWAGSEQGPHEVLALLAEADAGGETVSHAWAAYWRGNALQRLERTQEGEQAFVRVSEIAERLGWLQMQAWGLVQAAKAPFDRGDDKLATRRLEALLRVSQVMGSRDGIGTVLANLGLLARRRGDLREARELTERALDARGSKSFRACVQLHGTAAEILDSLGETKRALEHSHGALELAEAIGDEALVARGLLNLGAVHARRGDWARAITVSNRALDVYQRLGRIDQAMHARLNLSAIHAERGEYARSNDLLDEVIAWAEECGNVGRLAQALLGRANNDGAMGMPERALEGHRRALDLAAQVKQRDVAACAIGGIGGALEKLGRHDESIEWKERALTAAVALGDLRQQAGALHNLAIAYRDGGDYDEALTRLEEALDLSEKIGNRDGVVTHLTNLADVHARTGNLQQAEALLDRAARLARRSRSPLRLFRTFGTLAAIRWSAGEPSRALLAVEKALPLLETMLGHLGEEEGASLRSHHANTYAIGALSAAAIAEPADVLRFLESGRAGLLLESLGGRRALRWTDLPEHLAEAEGRARGAERAARTAYAHALDHGDRREIRRRARALDEALDDVRAVAARIQREAKRQASLFYPRSAPLEEVQDWLEEEQALVLYGLCLDEALALVVTQQDARVVRLGAMKDVEATIAHARVGVRSIAVRGPLPEEGSSAEQSRDGIGALRTLLVDPLNLPDDVTTVLVSPEGPLCYVPFGALFGDRNVAMTPSGTTHVLLLDEEREPGSGVLALGDPTYGEKVDPGAAEIYRGGAKLTALPATRDEALAVGDVTLLGDDANEAALREAIAKQKRWRAVHLACHGLIDPERPTLSSLALTRAGDEDGFLTALEVLRMEIPADLAVLSACETAKGKVVKGEGIVGLTRAFMYAGAPRVLCSLWKVDDDATRALMEKFYERWNPKEGEGLGAAEALRKAQAFVRGHEKWAHPYYWAAWVLWGLP